MPRAPQPRAAWDQVTGSYDITRHKIPCWHYHPLFIMPDAGGEREFGLEGRDRRIGLELFPQVDNGVGQPPPGIVLAEASGRGPRWRILAPNYRRQDLRGRTTPLDLLRC